MQDIEANTDARVIVISSTGKHFSAGMDLGVFSDPKAVPMNGDPGRMAENLRRVVLQLQDTLTSLEKIRLPVLAAIHGGCIGGALIWSVPLTVGTAPKTPILPSREPCWV